MFSAIWTETPTIEENRFSRQESCDPSPAYYRKVGTHISGLIEYHVVRDGYITRKDVEKRESQ